jgi:hypothetical protein
MAPGFQSTGGHWSVLHFTMRILRDTLGEMKLLEQHKGGNSIRNRDRVFSEINTTAA